MSVTRNRLIFTTCLSMLSGTALYATPVVAGFEWMPPEKKAVATPPSVMPEVIENDETMAPVSVVEEVETEAKTEILPSEEDVAPEIIYPKEDVAPEVSVMTDMPESEDEVVSEHIIVKEIKDTQEPRIHADNTDVFELEPVVATHQEEKTESKEGQITLNPYPVEDIAVPSKDVVVLSDEEGGVVKEDTSPSEPPLMHSENYDGLHYDIIEGFGSDMPLALALSQIVPPEYAYSFGQGVNPGTVVSWEGGAAWNDVLNTALMPVGYIAYIQNKMVLIKSNAPMSEKHSTVQPPVSSFTTQDETASTEKKTVDSAGIDDLSENDLAYEPLKTAYEDNQFHHAQEGAVYEPLEEITLENDTTETANIEKPDVEIIETDNISSPPLPFPQRNVILSPSATETNQPEANVLLGEKKKIIIPPKKPVIEAVSKIEQILPQEKNEEMVDFNTIDVEKGALTIIEIPVIDHPAPEEHIAVRDEQSFKNNVQEHVEERSISDAKSSEAQIEEIVATTSEPSIGFSLITAEQEKTVSSEETSLDLPVNEEVLNEKPSDHAIEETSSRPVEKPSIALMPVRMDVVEVEMPVEEATLPVKEVFPASIVGVDVNSEAAENSPSIYSVAPSDEIRVWQAKRGRDLQKTLQEWGEKENIKILWDTVGDYDLSSNIFINGTFKNAVDVLFSKGVENAPSYEITMEPSYALHVGG